MTAKQFKIWQAHLGINASEAARRLGKSADTISRYRNNGVPKNEATTIQLACKALAHEAMFDLAEPWMTSP